MSLTGKTRLAGVMGWPVTHSLSPRLHGFWLKKYGIDGVYVPLAVRPDDFAEAIRGLPRLGFMGANVTVPHKEVALAAVDLADPLARRIGAVNTIIVRRDGMLEGTNTDGFGFMENLRSAMPRWDVHAAPAAVIGAGGAARALCVALIDAGVPEIRLVNRTGSRAEALASEIGGPFRIVSWKERHFALEGAGLLANATTLGMTGQDPLEIQLSLLPPDAVVTDIVYAPLKTRLLMDAEARGNPWVDGLGMLLHQARPGFSAWFGREPEVTPALRSFMAEALQE